jgi:hypothetical protein
VDVILQAVIAPSSTAVLKALFVSMEVAKRSATVMQIVPTLNAAGQGFA